MIYPLRLHSRKPRVTAYAVERGSMEAAMIDAFKQPEGEENVCPPPGKGLQRKRRVLGSPL